MPAFANSEFFSLVFIALIVGIGSGWFLYRLYRAGVRYAAEGEAEDILQEVRDRVELQNLEEKEYIQELETELWTKEEAGMLALEEKIEDLEALSGERKQKADNRYSQERQKTVHIEQEVQAHEARVQTREKQIQGVRQQQKDLNDNYVEQLSKRLQQPKAEVTEEIITGILRETEEHSRKWVQQVEEETKEHQEELGKYVIDTALARFNRAYCGERGIAAVYFELPEQRNVLCDPAGKNLALIESLTGCDIVVEPESDLVGVAGFDPVRRELTRRLLERILKEKNTVSEKFINDKFEHIKRELFSIIKRDGDALAKEFGLQNLHPEIRQMMGSLRYRYSFTQNQYFHCAEVGWLCGLLAQELRSAIPVKKARRAGMLHDLGKSMDHQMDGGHAMIGANFIEARGEAPDIVHAVRSHHFDETPSTDLAFLVIAADAISGARPGARRSTMETYNQKVTELDGIARSFDGVTDCYVLNGGRELRVMVNGKRIDDQRAMKMGAEMATRIENECNYPGQIKVMVVRETVVVETTRAHG